MAAALTPQEPAATSRSPVLRRILTSSRPGACALLGFGAALLVTHGWSAPLELGFAWLAAGVVLYGAAVFAAPRGALG